MVHGDLLLRHKKFETAVEYYRQTEMLLKDDSTRRSPKDTRFLLACLNFKKNVINGNSKSLDRKELAELSHQINDLDASRYLKRAFQLPEKVWIKMKTK